MELLSVKNLSVRYMKGNFKDIGIKEYLLKKISGKYEAKEFYANTNITFSLSGGDTLGIIGKNGAGKSTLLKAISGILKPCEGEIIRKGRICALLELASGFDGELTVKENTYLRGALLGYSKSFMKETYGEIIEFAELSDFESTPFKHLSSGMKSRLAFSIASHVTPDILILDEVLSVGDGAFRKKSEERMREIMKNGAASIIVSHTLSSIRGNCNKILWLERGRQIEYGYDTERILALYEKFLKSGELP